MIDKSYVNVVERIKEQIGRTHHITWGSKFLSELSSKITSEFPSAKCFSVSTLKNMTKFP